ncbi:MAG: recombinase family protein [Planctomycetes bacterium]|nr:recombinase family protein [Planctomycetota bacterium]
MTTEIIGYLRVSTKRQGASGLGLEGQRMAVETYARTIGAKVGAWYTEVESGKKSDRPELARAVGHAKRSKVTLCVAKLDRLARDMEFTAKLMNSTVEFVACDNPTANRLTLHILAAVAENDARNISERTKAALAAAKARGTKLGSARDGHWAGREDTRLAGARRGAVAAAAARSHLADEAYVDLLPFLKKMRADGLSLREMAEKLNEAGHKTRRGKQWNAMQVSRVLARGVAE